MKAVITGATKGIGRAIAIQLASNGYSVAICARDKKALDLFKKELEIFGGEVLVFQADCCKKTEVLDFCNFVLEKWDRVDVLVNNVGVFTPVLLMEEEDEIFEQQLSINLMASYYLTKRIGNAMKSEKSGHIFNISSLNALYNRQSAGSYGVTKSAMLSLNNITREELAPFNVKVTAIIPGETFTSSWEGTSIPEDQFVQPLEIAGMLYSILKLGANTQVDEIVIKPLKFNF